MPPRTASAQLTTTLLTGREYLRVSFDRSGRQRSNEEQHDENVATAPSLGVGKLGKPYSDEGSASKHQRKRRLDFDALTDDLAAGRFGADVLVMWESSRGSRKVGEWVELIEACEAAGVRIMVTTHHRLYDPANARDRRSLLEDAVDSEYETAKLSARTRRGTAATAAKGDPHGRIPFGYRRVYDSQTKRLVAQEPDPAEASVVVELFDRVAAGHSLTGIGKDFTARGIVSRKGVPFSAQTLRGMLLAPVYAARRIHSPTRQRGAYRGDPELIYDATWPALITDETFYAVRARLMDPARTTTRPGRAKHLLSMLARCDVCGGVLCATYRNGSRQYQCRDAGHVLVDADPLDAWTEHQILELIADAAKAERLLPDGDGDELAEARDEVARIRAEHTDLIAQVGAGTVSATLAAGSEPGILARLRLAEARVQELATPSGLRGLIEPGEQALVRWDDDELTPMAVKREVVRLLFAPGLLGVLSVARVDGDSSVRARIRIDGQPLSPVVSSV